MNLLLHSYFKIEVQTNLSLLTQTNQNYSRNNNVNLEQKDEFEKPKSISCSFRNKIILHCLFIYSYYQMGILV